MRSRDSRQRRLATAGLYCCTDGRGDLSQFAAFVDAMFAAGVDIVQFRDKSMDPRTALPYIECLRESANHHNSLSCVNDRADLAAITGVDIVHVGQDDLTPQQARRIVGDEVLIGQSTHALDEALAADRDPDVDYFAVGPVWPTPTKPGRPAPGLSLIRDVSESACVTPWFAIGGIDEHRVAEVTTAGATRIVVVRALTMAQDVAEAASALRSALGAGSNR